MSSLETFCESAHRLLQHLEREIEHQFRILPVAKLIASFVTNATYLFENQLYEWFWVKKNACLTKAQFNANAFLRNWYRMRTDRTIEGLPFGINAIISEDETDCRRCHRYQCYYRHSLRPSYPDNQSCWRIAVRLLG